MMPVNVMPTKNARLKSRCGFVVSSTMFTESSKPMIAKNASAAPPTTSENGSAPSLNRSACAVLAARLSTAVEVEAVGRSERGLHRSRGVVRRLAGLFAVDAFAGGFIVQSFIVFWFGRQFGADAALMGLVFFGVGLLQAGSSVLAGWLGGRIGLLNTMVFTHLPSNVILALIPLAPSLAVAVLLLLARSALSQMDVPARQAYVAALVDPAERTAAAAYTNAARHVVRPVGPALASVSMTMAAGVPFLVAGGLKAVYDVALYFMFRRVRLGDD